VRTKLTRSPVAGSGLMAGHGIAVNAEQRYAFWDLTSESADAEALYWIEDLDFNGKSTWHGPANPVAGGLQAPPDTVQSTTLRDVGRNGRRRGKLFVTEGAQLERTPKARALASRVVTSSPALDAQWALAAGAAVKIGINHAGWYRLTQPELVAAGLDPRANPRMLRLFAGGIEHAILVVGEADGVFDASDAIEFYGTGVDTPYTDTRVYWLQAGTTAGQRISMRERPARGGNTAPSFWYTVQQKDRSIFFAALQNGDAENWFGAFISPDPSQIELTLSHPDAGATSSAQLEITLQGVTGDPAIASDHLVTVLVNDTPLGDMVFDGQSLATQTFAVPMALLRDGPNAITLVAAGGDADYSLVDTVRLSYWHTYEADADRLTVITDGSRSVTISGFTSGAIRVVDISDPSTVEELLGTVSVDGSGLSAITARTAQPGVRTLLAFTDMTIAVPVSMRANHPSVWHDAVHTEDYLALSHATFTAAAGQLVSLRSKQGFTADVIDVEDLYDEFSFGEKTPQAIKDFIVRAKTVWRRAPRFVTLIGDATMDPRDYAGFGDADFVPTKQVPMSRIVLETASDDWFVDVDDDGLPDLAIGRLPTRTVAQATAMVRKIAGYEADGDAPWLKDVLFVADENQSNTFEAASRRLEALLPAGYNAHELFSRQLSADVLGQSLAGQVAEGRLIVNYSGHGSVGVWGAGGDLLTPEGAAAWTNGGRLPLVVAMNCLNGFFHGIYDEESLAETLMRAPTGGAVAVWASSSLTDASAQAIVNQELFRQIFHQGAPTLGEAVAAAKRVISNRDLRSSWIFFGDPALRLRGVAAASRPSDTTAAPDASVSTGPAPQSDTGATSGEASDAASKHRIRLADFTGDGRDDLLFYADDSGAWRALFSDAGSLTPAAGHWGGGWQITATRLNDDAAADLFFYRPATGEWIERLNIEKGRFALRASGTALPDQQVLFADVTGDGRDDRLLYDAHTGMVAVTTHDRVADVTEPVRTWPSGATLHVADVTGDGLADIVGYDALTGRGFIAVRVKANFIVHATDWGIGWVVTPARLSDPRRSDLVFYNPTVGSARLAFSDSRGGFSYEAREWVPGLSLQAADLNGDGRDDLVGSNARTGVWLATAVTRGVLVEYTGQWTLGWHVATGDLDGNGSAEILMYNPLTGAAFRGSMLSPEVFEYRPETWVAGAHLIGRSR
jgi:hypothetical protein